jgi:hypothetical protein
MHTRTLLAAAALALLLSACQFGNPAPSLPRASFGSPHRTLLMFGDSLMGQHDTSFPSVLAAHGYDATVIDAHVNGSGLIGPVGDAGSALEWVQEKVAEHPEADPIVLEWAGACAVCGTTVSGVSYPTIGDRENGFYSTWVEHAQEIIDWLHDQGKTVVWVVSPPLGQDSASNKVTVEAAQVLSFLDGIVIGPAASRTTIDWFTALSDANRQYATTLWYDGAFNTVRADDLVHLTTVGATRASTWTLAALAPVLAAMPPPAPATASLPTGLVEVGDPVRLGGDRGL